MRRPHQTAAVPPIMRGFEMRAGFVSAKELRQSVLRANPIYPGARAARHSAVRKRLRYGILQPANCGWALHTFAHKSVRLTPSIVITSLFASINTRQWPAAVIA